MASNVRFSNPKTLAKPPGYSYVVEATGPNRLIFIAGQLGLDMENKLVGAPGDFHAQAEKAIENLKLALADAGATLKDVVKINNYLVDVAHLDFPRGARPALQHVGAAGEHDSRHLAAGTAWRPVRDRGYRGAAGKSRESDKGRCAARREKGQGTASPQVSGSDAGGSKQNASALHPNCRLHAHRPVAAHAVRRRDRERSASRS